MMFVNVRITRTLRKYQFNTKIIIGPVMLKVVKDFPMLVKFLMSSHDAKGSTITSALNPYFIASKQRTCM